MKILLENQDVFKKFMKSLICAVLLVVVMGVSYFVRVGIWQKQNDRLGGNMIFTLESALLFRYARLSLTDDIPAHDYKVEAPSGVNPTETFSLGGGIFLGKVYKLCKTLGMINDSCSFEVFHRYAMPAYFVVLSLLAMFFAVLTISGNIWLAVVLSFWYGVCIPSVIRSTGQEFMRENFALPLIFCHVATFIYAFKNNKSFLYFISGLFIALAWYLWDMTHLYLYVLSVFLMTVSKIKVRDLLYLTVPVVLVTFISPYLYYHKAFISLPVIFFLINLVTQFISIKNSNFTRGKLLFTRFALAGLSIIFIYLLTGYGEDYGHFFQLLAAKIRFFNIKPLVPSKLSFTARVLWTPALHSAKWADVKFYFFYLFIMNAVILTSVLFKKSSIQLDATEKYILFCFIIFCFLFIMFLRINVYTVFFSVLLISFCYKYKKITWQKITFIVIVLLSVVDFARTKSNEQYLGREENYHSLNTLIQWIQENTKENAPILASFNLAGPIVNYTDRPVVLQPKFEKADIRLKYEIFLRRLFGENEKPFYDFACGLKARYFVYEKGTSWNRSIYSPAYFVALNNYDAETKNILVNKFEGDIRRLSKFSQVYENSKYKVFRVIDSEDVRTANVLFDEAVELIDNDKIDEAENKLRRALGLYPAFRKARMRLGSVLWTRGEKNEAHYQWRYGKMIKNDV